MQMQSGEGMSSRIDINRFSISWRLLLSSDAFSSVRLSSLRPPMMYGMVAPVTNLLSFTIQSQEGMCQQTWFRTSRTNLLHPITAEDPNALDVCLFERFAVPNH